MRWNTISWRPHSLFSATSHQNPSNYVRSSGNTSSTHCSRKHSSSAKLLTSPAKLGRHLGRFCLHDPSHASSIHISHLSRHLGQFCLHDPSQARSTTLAATLAAISAGLIKHGQQDGRKGKEAVHQHSQEGREAE